MQREIKGEPTSWDMLEWLGVPSIDHVDKLIEDFNHGEWEFGTLPPKSEALPNLKLLHENDIDIIAITCCSENHTTKSFKL